MPPFLFNQNYEIMRKFRCDYHYVDELIRRYEEAGGQVICLNDGCIARGKGKNVRANRLATEQIIEGYLPIGCAQAAMLTRRAAYDALVDNI